MKKGFETTVGAFTFKMESGTTKKAKASYLHVYENGKRVTAIGTYWDNKKAKFNTTLFLIEDASITEIALLVNELFGTIMHVKISQNGYCKKYSGVKGARLFWSRRK